MCVDFIIHYFVFDQSAARLCIVICLYIAGSLINPIIMINLDRQLSLMNLNNFSILTLTAGLLTTRTFGLCFFANLSGLKWS